MVQLGSLVCLVGVPLLACGPGPPRAARLEPLGAFPASGHVLGGVLYTLRIYERAVVANRFGASFINSDEHILPPELNATALGGARSGPGLLRLDGIADRGCWPRWRISRGCVWAAWVRPYDSTWFFRFPMGDLRSAMRGRRVERAHQLGVRPIETISVLFALFREKGRSLFFSSGWDLVPGPGNEVSLFLAWRGELRMWRGRLTPPKESPLALEEPPIKWEGARVVDYYTEVHPPVFRIKADLKEQFFAHPGGKDFFLVTQSGKVHRLRQDGKKWRLDLVWADKARPVRLLVTDSKRDRTFAFAHSRGRPTKEAPDVYFPLSGEIKPVPYERAEGSPAGASSGERALLAAARLLIKKGEIKAK